MVKEVQQTVNEFGHLDTLGNNVAEHYPQESSENITAEQLERAFRVAWAAVKRDYEKGEDGNWHRKAES